MCKIVLSLVVAVAGLVVVGESRADHFVTGHFRHSGLYAQPHLSYVRPHFQSNPDRNFYNNYSTFPNVNPYTGGIGTHHYPTYRPYSAPRAWGWSFGF